ncbi:thioredoxin family protein [Bacillus sp. FJAT-49732]|uniref:Thioredoxin family protein n=1 Tax=Lederbergia citrisecunda TaxID=2833583 RepID=A0A942TQ46_9BACI|nr:thioredoxin family protein [Lederbergia citrisecunda]MBS4200199.1 thioredoxin family protein [Lederbergia citrisecunda]
MKDVTKEDIMVMIDQHETTMLYFYTPLCGTCQVAGKMLGVVEQMFPNLLFGKADLNYVPELAKNFSIESVPCLLILKEGKVQEKIYAFKSVPYLHELISSYS